MIVGISLLVTFLFISGLSIVVVTKLKCFNSNEAIVAHLKYVTSEYYRI